VVYGRRLDARPLIGQAFHGSPAAEAPSTSPVTETSPNRNPTRAGRALASPCPRRVPCSGDSLRRVSAFLGTAKNSLQNDVVESPVADEAAAEGEHGLVHVGAALVADEESFELAEVGKGPLDDPAHAPQPGAVLALAPGDHRPHAQRPGEAAVLVVVVASIADDFPGPAPWSSDQPGDRRHPLEQGDQLGDVVAVAARERVGERDPARIDEEVVLRACPAPVHRARARRGAPFFACRWLESTTARDHSIAPAARRRVSRSACKVSQTPTRCHSSRRRQHVYPDPYPSSCGRCIHAIPVCSTNRIPQSASRSGRRLRPGYLKRRSLHGISGSTSSHNSSETSHGALAAIDTPPSLTTDADGLRRQGAGPFNLQ
jgi:hypothetical protein